MNTTRRGFLAAGAAFGVVGGVRAAADGRKLRVGILSDIHCHHPAALERFERALTLFRRERVDAVLIAGDLFTRGTIAELERVAQTWFRVFPKDALPDGTHVERLFVTGNHDEVDWDPGQYRDFAELKSKCFRLNREATWQRLWGEPYRKISSKEVKGYTFVLRHWLGRAVNLLGQTVPAEDEVLPAFMAREAAKLRACGKPFFYVQHEPLDETVNATWLFGGTHWDNGQTGRGLKEKALFETCPNAVVLTGHSHDTLTDEMSIWQGRFTAVNCSSCTGYIFTQPGRLNGFNCEDFNRVPALEMPTFDHCEPRQGLVMDVFDDRIVFRRRDVWNDERLDGDWVVPLFANGATVPPNGTPKYDFHARKAASRPPTFAPGSKIEVSYVKDGHARKVGTPTCSLDPQDVHPQIRVSFPPITTKTSPTRAFDFGVACEHVTGSLVTMVKECRVFSPKFCMAEAREAVPCTCDFNAAIIPRNCKAKVRFTVTPYDCWGNAGKPLVGEWFEIEKLLK